MSAVIVCFSPDLSEALLPMQPSDVLDMPVDPNEPTYCLCHQVSYGEMIGCDNPDVRSNWFRTSFSSGSGGDQQPDTHVFSFQCPIEWFHFACVDLATKPKGKW